MSIKRSQKKFGSAVVTPRKKDRSPRNPEKSALLSMVHLSPFPLSCLPKVMQQYVRETTDAICCDGPYGVIAVPLLACLARLIVNKRCVRLPSGAGWYEYAIIWALVIGPASSRKTPFFREAMKFLEQIQEKDPKTIYTADDATLPGIRDALQRQPDRTLMLNPSELADALGALNRRGRSVPNRGAWLDAWSLTSSRILRANKFSLMPKVSWSLTRTIQPEVFAELILSEGSLNDGLCSRFLPVYYEPQRAFQESDQPKGPATDADMQAVFDRLHKLPGKLDPTGQYYEPIPIPLSDEAAELWREFRRQHGEEQFTMSRELHAAYGKLEAYAARIALIFQMVVWASNYEKDKKAQQQKITALNMRRAIELVTWFKEQVHFVYARLGSTASELKQERLIDLIRRNNREITARALMRKSPVEYGTAPKAEKALNALVANQIAERKLIKTKGRPYHRYYLL